MISRENISVHDAGLSGMTDKPPFQQLTMEEVNQKKGTNGYRVVSTFSGAGGSCIGLKLAGFDVLYGVEFIPSAQEIYEMNHDSFLDKRDIREITGEDILTKCNLKKGELELFEGSPPCASFSQLGKGTETWNCEKFYSGTHQRVDDLFFEYIRLVDEIRPLMFVAENVPALAQGKNKGMLKLIVNNLRDIGYEVEIRLVDATYLDVPQKRQRLILIGSRKDTGIKINFPKPKKYQYVVNDVIPDFQDHKPSEEYLTFQNSMYLQDRFDYCREHHLHNFAEASKVLHGKRSGYAYRLVYGDEFAPTFIQKIECWHGYQNRSISIDEAKILQTFPVDFQLKGSFIKQWERIGRSVPPRVYEAVGLCIKKSLDDYYGKE